MPTIQTQEILPAIRTAAKVAGGARTPAHRAVWLQFSGQTLLVRATDTQVDYVARLPLQSPVVEDIVVGIEGKMLAGLLAKMGPGEISIHPPDEKEDTSTCRIQQGRRKFDIAAVQSYWYSPGDPFPDSVPDVETWFLTGTDLADCIQSVEYCVSSDETLKSFNCLLLDKSTTDARAVAVGLNGHQMGVRRFDGGQIISGLPEGGLRIQRKFLPDLRGWMDGLEIEAALHKHRLHLRDAGKSEHWSIPTHQDPYPDWSQLIAKSGDGSKTMTVHRQPFLDCLERLKFFTSDESMAVFLSPEEQTVSLNAQSSGRGEGSDYCPIVRQGDLFKIAFPVDDLARIVGAFRGDEVVFIFSEPHGPCILREQTGSDQYEVLLMPMEIRDEVVLDEEASE